METLSDPRLAAGDSYDNCVAGQSGLQEMQATSGTSSTDIVETELSMSIHSAV